MGGGEGREVYEYSDGGAVTVSFSYGLCIAGAEVMLIRGPVSLNRYLPG